MVREDTRLTKSNVSTPKYEKRRRGKSADRVQQRTLGGRRGMSVHALQDYPPGTPRIGAKILSRNQSVFSSSSGGLNGPKPSAPHSVSSLATSEAGSAKMSNGVNPGPPSNEAPLYEKLNWTHLYDPKSKEEVVLHRRVGFYRFKGDIGSGNFSKVKMAHHQLTKEKVAVKIIDKGKLDGKTQRMVTREINIMDSLSHPNLIRLFEVTETMSGIYLMMEYAPGGELFVRLAENGSYSEFEAQIIFAQIASAVSYMHERHFIHRDLKAENVFFASHYIQQQKHLPSPQEIRVKVGDFGFATQVNKIDQHLTTFCGSPPYAAPELFQDDHYYGPSVDIWALGILLYLMVTGSMPFKGTTVAELKNAILDGHFEMPDYLSQNCIDLIGGILKRRPDWRLTLAQIRESNWLSGVAWPEGDNKFRKLPNLQQPDLGPVEMKTRQVLQEIGIESTLLESHVEQGARSHVIGAFRIIQNKILKAEEQPSEMATNGEKSLETSQNNGKTSSWRSIPTTPDHISQVKQNGARIEDQDKPTNKKNKKSKLCLIL